MEKVPRRGERVVEWAHERERVCLCVCVCESESEGAFSAHRQSIFTI